MMGRARELHVRPGMDVFSAYDNDYLGSVVKIFPGQAPPQVGSRTGQSADDPTNRTSQQGTLHSPDLVHEEDHAASPSYYQGKRQLGEEMGPFPTIGVGNSGPVKQSSRQQYATRSRGTLSQAGWITVRPGRINLGILTPPFYVPVSAIVSMSMERIVIDARKGQIPAEWRQPPRR